MDLDAVLASAGVAAADLPRDLIEKMRLRARDPSQRLQIGRFVIGGELGRGGMGVVYDAWDPRIERRVAIKTVEPDLVPDERDREEVIERFRREIKIVGKLQHPGIITIFDYGEEPELRRGDDPFAPGRIYFYVMEYLEGRSLARALRDRVILPDVEAVEVAIDIAEALDVAHAKGVIHRDIKPSNIFLRSNGQAVLLDFGIAKTDHAPLTRQGQILGTPSYLAPERLREKEVPVDGRADLFSLGILLYTMLTGEAPFAGDNVYDLIDKITKQSHPKLNRSTPGGRALSRVLDKLLAKRPEDRYQSAAESASALGEVRAMLVKTTPDVSDLAAAPVREPMENAATEIATPSDPLSLPVAPALPSGTRPELALNRKTRPINVEEELAKAREEMDYEASYPSPRVWDPSDLRELDESDLELIEGARAGGDETEQGPDGTSKGMQAIDDTPEAIQPEPEHLRTRVERGPTRQLHGSGPVAVVPSGPLSGKPEVTETAAGPVPKRRASSLGDEETVAEPEGLAPATEPPGPIKPASTASGSPAKLRAGSPEHSEQETETLARRQKTMPPRSATARARRPRIEASLIDEQDVIVKPASLDTLKPDEMPTQTGFLRKTPPGGTPVVAKPHDPLETDIVRARVVPAKDPAEAAAEAAAAGAAPERQRPAVEVQSRKPTSSPPAKEPEAPKSAAVARKTFESKKRGPAARKPSVAAPREPGEIQISGTDLDNPEARRQLVRRRVVILLGAVLFAVAFGLLIGRLKRKPAVNLSPAAQESVAPAPEARQQEAAAPAARTPAQLLAEAGEAQAGGRFDEADRAYQAAIAASSKEDDVHVEALLGRARLLRQTNRSDEAWPLYARVIGLRPNSREANDARATLQAAGVGAEGAPAAVPGAALPAAAVPVPSPPPPAAPQAPAHAPAPPAAPRPAAAKVAAPPAPAPKPAPPAAAPVPGAQLPPEERCKQLAAVGLSDPKAGLAGFEKLDKDAPGTPCVFWNLGILHKRLGDDRSALAAYKRYLELSPNAPNRRAVEERIQALSRTTPP